MNRYPIAAAHAVDLRRTTVWWAVAIAAVTGLIALGFTTVDGQSELDESMADLPDAVRALIGGLDGVSYTSPAGYLHGQFFANLFPLLLSILAIGMGARAIGGAETDGHLDLLATHPVRRRRIATERAVVVFAVVTTIAVVGLLTLLALGGPAGLDDGGPGVASVVAATAGAWALATLHGSVAFAVGAATGSRTAALASAATFATAGFLLQSIAAAGSLDVVGAVSPWDWFTSSSPLVDGPAAAVLPVGSSLVLAGLASASGVLRLEKRDLR